MLTYEQVNKMILEDTILTPTTKAILVEYCSDTTEHSVLLITFKDLLVQVWQRLYSHEDSNEIKRILNQEMSDSLCKCFTGRLSRLINVLNGFYDDIIVKIGSNEQIGNIITIVRDKLGADYSVEKHRELVIAELKEREYSDEVIELIDSYNEIIKLCKFKKDIKAHLVTYNKKNYISYCALNKDECSASGQITLDYMINHFKDLEERHNSKGERIKWKTTGTASSAK